MGLANQEGIVLRSYPFGEADRVVVLISPSHGKLRTVAKGVRRTKSRFGGRLEPFTHLSLVLYEGRNLDTITQVSVLDAFPGLRSDLDRVLAAGRMVEAIDAVAQEQEASNRLFLLLLRGLRAVEAGPAHPDLVTAFLLKLARAIGLAPALTACALCGSTEDLDRFGLSAGGVVCTRCDSTSTVRLQPGLTNYLVGLAAAELTELPDFDSTRSGGASGLTRRFFEHHLERRLVSLTHLDG